MDQRDQTDDDGLQESIEADETVQQLDDPGKPIVEVKPVAEAVVEPPDIVQADTEPWNGKVSERPDMYGFIARLDKQLSSERASFSAQLSRLVDQQLTKHHKKLLSKLEAHIGSTPPSKDGQGICSTPLAIQIPPSPKRTSKSATDAACRKSRRSERSDSGPDMSASCSQPETEAEPTKTSASNVTADKTLSLSDKWTAQKAAIKRHRSKLVASLANHNHEAPETGVMQGIHDSAAFELCVASAILLNVMIMAVEVQYTGCKVSSLLDYPDCLEYLGPEFPFHIIEVGFTVLAVFFSFFFLLEFLLRVYILRAAALRNAWMWFDLLILAFGAVDTLGRLGSSLYLGINPTAMRAARIMRMLRMLKFIRAKDSFHTLFLMLKSILASRHAFVCSILILYFTMTCFGLLMNQLLYTYLTDASVNHDDRRLIYDYFGTYTRMLITMFEITLGNWAPPTRDLMTKVSQWWGLFIVLYRCVFCFALVNVTGAVFITETSRVAVDDEVQMVRKARAERKLACTLTEVFVEMDSSCDGFLTKQELEQAMLDPVVKNLLEVLDLHVHDIEELFQLMDNGTGMVPQKEFNRHIIEFRGPAKSINQVVMLDQLKAMSLKLEHVCANVDDVNGALKAAAQERQNSCSLPFGTSSWGVRTSSQLDP